VKLRTKILITILLAILVWALSTYGATKPPMYTAQDMAAFYASMNEEFFMDQLPKNVVLQFSREIKDPDGSDDIANTFCLEGHCTISVNPDYNISFNQGKMSITHEMCHVKLNMSGHIEDSNQHGPLFQECMIGIAARGGMRESW
jgi:hypothetical protein